MNPTQHEIAILWASAESAGYGHKRITVEVGYKGEKMHFKATTANTQAYDDATDLEGQEKYDALYEIVKSSIDNQVSEWIYTQFNEGH